MHILLCGLLAASLCVSQAFAADTRLMSDSQYKMFLTHVESKLPEWEKSLKKVDPAKANTSYAAGETITQSRNIGLLEIGYVRQSLAKLRVKRTVSEELALHGFLRGVHDAMDSVVGMEVASGLTLSSLESYGSEISKIERLIANDVTVRVELLEKGACP